ncbi:MAG: SnoaL-like domain-containing protein [Saccharothrix sp.]|jgi:ketosteroid isomerase-like protein|nr:SnoaL-like domain-containing protein [Saccharothrix sp.]
MPDELSRNVRTVHTFLRLLEEMDIDAWIELWAEGADHYYPFGTRMFPHHIVGKTAVYSRWKDTPGLFESWSFPITDAWEDGDTVIARFEGNCLLKGGKRYRNTYLSIFKFTDAGQIYEYHEFFDPIIAAEDFGLARIDYQS